MKTKMKYAIIILLAIVAQGYSNDKVENDWTKDELKGRVRSFSQFIYVVVDRFGNIEKGNCLDYIQIKYDEKGNRIEENEYNSDGSLKSKATYKYDEKGNKIEENRYNSDGSLDKKYTYKYDEKGNRIEKNEYNSDGSIVIEKWTNKNEYDKQGNWIKTIVFKNEIPRNIVERQIEYY